MIPRKKGPFGLHPQDPLPVVIIGNGPSGICLSYFLSGYTPYLKEVVSHPNPILHQKLQEISGQSLLEQDLEYLSEGLDGRSTSPLSLLFDALLRPDGDLGGSAESLLTWRKEPERGVAHLVLGKGPPGGAWQAMEESMITLSLGDWMEMPDLSFRDWITRKGRQLRNNRAATRDIAQYYQHYVEVKGLQEHFRCGALVTSVRLLPRDSHQGAMGGMEGPSEGPEVTPSTLYEIRGEQEETGSRRSPFCLYARNVVLATGTYDRPSRLGVEGEELPFVHHTMGDLEGALRGTQRPGSGSDPLLVVGAGLTAADAVLLGRGAGMPILHAFRRRAQDPALVFHQLPLIMFPEYHKVHDMMRAPADGTYPGYVSLPHHRVLNFAPGGKCTLQDIPSGKIQAVQVSMALVLIGSNPNLSFLHNGGRGLAFDPEQPVNAKRNPLDTNPFTYEISRQPGLPNNFPPGPWPVPILGNLLQLNLVNPLDDLKKLSERYGKIYSIYIGRKPAVVLHGLQAMKEALSTQSVEFAGRPQGLLINKITEDKGLALLTYGLMWKEHRRFALMTLRNFGLGKRSMEERILGEISYIVSHFEKIAGKAIDPQILFHKAAFNVICTVLFGMRFKYEDEFLLSNIHRIAENSKIINGPWGMIYDMLPMLRSLPLPFREAFLNCKMIRESMADQVSRHKKTRVPGEPRDLIDCYLDEMEKRCDSGSSFSEYQLACYLLDLLFAGTDTTANTLLTAFLYLTTHQDVQERCQKEIDEALGEEEQASFEDRHRMPYTQATIHEAQRVADTLPLSVFHTTTKDTRLMGYDIPKETLIIPNLSSVLHEESQWKFPHDFNPSNFLNDQGEFVKPEAFMPFSAGPRICPGEGLARIELFLVLVTLLRRFKFIWPEDAGEPDCTLVFGVTQTPKPYRMVFRLRGDTECVQS
ncbi:hypothetical protein GJAV_G00245790 [Gymnothorax javanicus]|nr:hypothetical protein GJAV_G00245790 [Gymnothorax javanicus]